MLTERSSKILEAAIQGFIDEGFPISSGWLYDSYDFGIKPAMIRAELEGLSRQGFLEQPHHSAGRVPSNLGYEFFVERVLDKKEPGTIGWVSNLFEEHAWPDLLGKMSSSLGMLSAAMAAERVYKTGLEELIENWNEPQLIKEVVRDFTNLENRFEEAMGVLKAKNEPHVFIGKKSPLTESEELSVVAGSYGDGSRRVILVAIGPKRMDYKKAVKVFSAIGGSVSGGKNPHGRRK